MYSSRLGWIVPDYVPEEVIASIEQLQDPQLAYRFDGRVQGIDPGSGLNQASLKALKQYGLTSMELVASSSAAMAAVLAQAIDEQRWLIATSWTPHWMFARYKLRFLDDPKGSFGATERIHAVARQGMDQLHPAVTAFLSRFHLPESDLDGLLLQAQESSVETAVSTYLARHPNRVRHWTTGRPGKARNLIHIESISTRYRSLFSAADQINRSSIPFGHSERARSRSISKSSKLKPGPTQQLTRL